MDVTERDTLDSKGVWKRQSTLIKRHYVQQKACTLTQFPTHPLDLLQDTWTKSY